MILNRADKVMWQRNLHQELLDASAASPFCWARDGVTAPAHGGKAKFFDGSQPPIIRECT
jgi:hypothetical protein